MNIRNPILFVDIDGVLSSDYRTLNLPNVQALQHILARTNVDIVISSAWRVIHNISNLRLIFQGSLPPNVIFVCDPSRIIGVTPFDMDEERGSEILRWLRMNTDENNPNFVILDDDTFDLGIVIDRVIEVDPLVGLTMANAEQAILMLTNT